jgi:hypothetical protein
MTTSEQIREAIAEHLEYQSEWRAQKAEEYPGDDRNRIVADALATAAEQVRLLPDSDWNRFARLAKLADDRSIDANTLLSFSDETGEDVTSALHYGNEPGGYNAEAFSVETLLERIDRATVESWRANTSRGATLASQLHASTSVTAALSTEPRGLDPPA